MEVRIFLIVYLLNLVQSKVLDLTCEQIRSFVDGHNSRRLSLAQGNVPNQPAASDMKSMIWDNELADKAAKWASKNKFKHNRDRTIGSRRFKTGENLYIEYSSNINKKLDINSALQAWFDEYKYYTYGPMKHFRSHKQVGHYTQMAWSDSVYIGCGVYEHLKHRMKEYFVVCNYGPAGNVKNQPPYTTAGSSGELTCSGDCSKKYGDKC